MHLYKKPVRRTGCVSLSMTEWRKITTGDTITVDLGYDGFDDEIKKLVVVEPWMLELAAVQGQDYVVLPYSKGSWLYRKYGA